MRWTLILLAWVASAQTVTVPATVRQGNTLRLHGPAGAVAVRMDGRSFRLFPQDNGEPFGLLPVRVKQKPGRYTIEFVNQAGLAIQSATTQVLDAHFPKQFVTLPESVTELKPSPDEEDATKAFRETVSDKRYWAEPLARPVPGCMTSQFGVERWVNGNDTGNYHGGLDLRGAAGTPVRAAASGTVRLAREWNMHGRTVGIDHGQGLLSMYLHMSKIAAVEGAVVHTGDIIGYVGTTGRSNAPHLHWTLYVNGATVNPLDWVKVESCYASAPGAKKVVRKK